MHDYNTFKCFFILYGTLLTVFSLSYSEPVWSTSLGKQPMVQDKTTTGQLDQAKTLKYNIFLCFLKLCEYFKEFKAQLKWITCSY